MPIVATPKGGPPFAEVEGRPVTLPSVYCHWLRPAAPANEKDAGMPEGPQPLPIRYTCNGCDHLKTEWWKEYLGDETDSGTSAFCEKADKSITAYWYAGDAPPSWCPLLTDETRTR